MDTESIEATNLTVVRPIMDIINRGLSTLNVNNLMRVVATLNKYSVHGFFNFYKEIDAFNPKYTLAALYQGGLSLPNEVYYIDDDYEEIITKYVNHISNMFNLYYGNETLSREYADKVLELEREIAKITVPQEELIDPTKSFNKIGFSGLVELAPELPWSVWRQSLGKNDLKEIAVDAKDFFKKLGGVILEHEDKWIPYLEWKVLHRMASLLPERFVVEDFEFFGKVLNGLKEMEPRERKCVKITDRYLAELVGIYYSERRFPEESKRLAQELIDLIEEAFEDNLDDLEWMDEKTKERARTKAKKITNMIGYPDNPKKYVSPLNKNTFAANILNLGVKAFFDELRDIQKPTNHFEWLMSPATVNAYYDPTKNQIVFPAGILQAPFFNANFPPAVNHGGIGMVVGHEITHGFDNQGSQYDGDGKLENWWEDETSEEFQKKVDCVIDFYSKYEVLPGHFINGNLTQGENIADMGGIKMTYEAFVKNYRDIVDDESILKGYTNRQLFFISFAQTWCSKWTDELMKVRLLTDPHSPPEFRVKGSLSNYEEFSRVFECPPGSGMNPEEKCEVW